jgi:hypothetical protein
MKMEPMNLHPAQPDRIGCSAALELAQEAIASDRTRPLPPEAEVHIESCRNCRAEMEAIGEVDDVLSLAFGAVRRRIPGPTSRDIDEILTAVREPPPSAILFGRIRRSVKRMLYLTMLVLSFLLVALIAWALVRLVGGG